jgi:hypothetical protein
MPLIDIAVLLVLAVTVPAAITLLWRRGIRGRRLLVAGWLALLGLVLVTTMLAHSADIGKNLYLGARAFDGTPWSYNFRTYALFLLAGVLITQGARILAAVAAMARGEEAGWSDALRTALVILVVVAPLLPVHRFFAVPLTGIAAVAVLLLALTRRGAVARPTLRGAGRAEAVQEVAGV